MYVMYNRSNTKSWKSAAKLWTLRFTSWVQRGSIVGHWQVITISIARLQDLMNYSGLNFSQKLDQGYLSFYMVCNSPLYFRLCDIFDS